MSHHLYALRLAARKRGALAIEAEIPKADGDEIVEACRQRLDHGSHLACIDGADEGREIRDLHGREFGNVLACHAAAEGRGIEPRPGAGPAGLAGEDAIILQPDVRLQRIRVLGAETLGELGHHAFVGEADLAHLHLATIVEVKQVVALLLRIAGHRLVHVEQAGVAVDLPPP